MFRFILVIFVSLFSLTILVPTFAECDPAAGGSAAAFLTDCTTASTVPRLAVGVDK